MITCIFPKKGKLLLLLQSKSKYCFIFKGNINIIVQRLTLFRIQKSHREQTHQKQRLIHTRYLDRSILSELCSWSSNLTNFSLCQNETLHNSVQCPHTESSKSENVELCVVCNISTPAVIHFYFLEQSVGIQRYWQTGRTAWRYYLRMYNISLSKVQSERTENLRCGGSQTHNLL